MIDAGHDEWLTSGVMSRRTFAWLIDVVAVSVLVVLLKIALIAFGILTLGLGLPLLATLPLVPFVYVVGCIAARGATPGQMATGLMLRRNVDLGQPSGTEVLIWTVGLTITMLAGMIWTLVALLTVRHRTLHDLASGLVMVRAHALTPRTGIWTMPSTGPGRPFA